VKENILAREACKSEILVLKKTVFEKRAIPPIKGTTLCRLFMKVLMKALHKREGEAFTKLRRESLH
jgi:hypothetical protein